MYHRTAQILEVENILKKQQSYFKDMDDEVQRSQVNWLRSQTKGHLPGPQTGIILR